jgi:sulfonate transport system permease protein
MTPFLRHQAALARLRRVLIPWFVPLSLLSLWQLLAQAGVIPTRILPAPSAILLAGWSLAVSGELWHHLASSAGRAGTGFLIGASLGLLFGVLNGILPRAEVLLDSSFQMLRTIPPLAMIPLVILWFGIGEQARIFLVVVGVFFPVYLNTFHGIRGIDPGLVEMGRIYGLRRREIITHIILPGAMPSILVGIRFSLGIAWILLIVGEQIAADSGIGYMALNAREFMQTDVIVLSILLYALLGKFSDALSRFLEAKLLHWHPHHRAAAASSTRLSSAV